MTSTSVSVQVCACLLAFAAASRIVCADSYTFTPPPAVIEAGPIFRWNGTSVPVIQTGSDANTYLQIPPPTEPFLNAGPADVVRTERPLQFVRLYTTGTPSGPVGTWIMRPDAVRGLTISQLRDVFALPYTPNSWEIVTVPAQTCLLSGVAGPIMDSFPPGPSYPAGPWGHGGAEQTKIIGVSASPGCANAQYIPASSYVHQQALAEHALWYEYTAGSGNKQAVAYALDHLPPVAPYGDMYDVYGSLDYLNHGDPQPLRSALTQLAGQTYADFATVEIKSAEAFESALFGRMAALRGESAGGQPPKHGWGGALGGWGAVGGQGDDTLGLDYSMAGGAAGLDYRLDSTGSAGFALAYIRSSIDQRSGADSGSVESAQAALYGSFTGGALRLDGLLGYAYNSGELNRLISFPGVYRTASGSPDANLVFGAVEGGYEVQLGPLAKATPFVRLQSASVRQESLTETGAGAIDLAVASRDASSLRSVIGAQTAVVFDLGGAGPATVRTRLGWAHEYAGVDRAVEAGFVGGPGGAFLVHGARLAEDSLIAQVNGAVKIGDSSSLFVDYSGDLSAQGAFNAVAGGVRLIW